MVGTNNKTHQIFYVFLLQSKTQSKPKKMKLIATLMMMITMMMGALLVEGQLRGGTMIKQEMESPDMAEENLQDDRELKKKGSKTPKAPKTPVKTGKSPQNALPPPSKADYGPFISTDELSIMKSIYRENPELKFIVTRMTEGIIDRVIGKDKDKLCRQCQGPQPQGEE